MNVYTVDFLTTLIGKHVEIVVKNSEIVYSGVLRKVTSTYFCLEKALKIIGGNSSITTKTKTMTCDLIIIPRNQDFESLTIKGDDGTVEAITKVQVLDEQPALTVELEPTS